MDKSLLTAVIAVSLVAACMETEPLPRTSTPELLAAVRMGTMKLDCTTAACSNAWLDRAELAGDLTVQGRWAELSTLLAVTDYGSDLTYYLLGRTADGLGSPRAALGYYATARAKLGDAQSCYVSGLCKGLDIGAAIETGMVTARRRGTVWQASR